MPLQMTSTEQRTFATLSTILLSPQDYDVDSWRSAVNRAARTLLGADCVSFMLPTPEGIHLYSDEWPPEIPNAYPRRVAEADRAHGFWSRQILAGAWTRRRIYPRAMYRSSYYQDFVVPARAFDAIGITIQCPAGKLAGVLLHHTTRGGRRFGDRGVDILRMLLPAFSAGVRMQQRLEAVDCELTQAIDRINTMIFVVRSDGRLLHANPSAVAVLTERSAHCWRDALSTIVRAECRARRLGDASPVGSLHVVIDGLFRQIDVTFTVNGFEPEPVAVVGVRTDPNLATPSCERHPRLCVPLTIQEARVAKLLVDRKSNREVADLLEISEHTARHHTESVMQKLDVRSRRDIASALEAHAAD